MSGIKKEIRQGKKELSPQTTSPKSLSSTREIAEEIKEEIKETKETKGITKEGFIRVRSTRASGLYIYISLRKMGQRKTKKRNVERGG